MDKALVYETKDSRFDPGRGLMDGTLPHRFACLFFVTRDAIAWTCNVVGGTHFTYINLASKMWH